MSPARCRPAPSALKRREGRLRIVGPLLVGLPDVAAELDRWVPEEVALEVALSRLLYGAKDPWLDEGWSLADEITEAGTIDRMKVEVKEVEVSTKKGRTVKKIHEQRYPLSRTRHANVLTMKDRSFVRAEKKLGLIRDKSENAKLTDPILAHLEPIRRDMMDCLTYGIERFELAAKFFVRANIEELAAWFENADHPSIRLSWIVRQGGENLIVIRNTRRQTRDEIRVPDFSEMPTRDRLIDPLRRGLGGVVAA